MANPEVSYDSLANEGNPFNDKHESDDPFDVDDEDTPRNSGIIIHVVPETDKARWNHIEDLDSFFTRMYNYHQQRGFTVILLEEVFRLVRFLFTVWLLSFCLYCVRYPILFGDQRVAGTNTQNFTKVTLGDVIKSPRECIAGFSAATYFVLSIFFLIFIHQTIKVLYHIGQYWDIKKFYNTALNIEDANLDNVTWHEVQKKIREVQSEEQMCIQRQHLTELDIYHRILRFKNYLVALVNKNLLPTRVNFPLIGECVYLSSGLLYAYEFILFRGPWSPWNLKGDVAVRGNRVELARRLRNQIAGAAFITAILSPVIFLWMAANILFSNVALIKKEPSILGARMWTNYGRLSLRHFNELEHELHARLTRAYDSSEKYMSSFSSPIGVVISKNILFVCGGFIAVILLLGIYEEYVFQVEHVVTILACTMTVAVCCAVMIPSENQACNPEQLMTNILAHVHYMPSEWRGLAHTNTVRTEFGSYFQFKWTYILQEVLSPVLTPFILYFSFRPRSLEIVDFFRSFTVQVVGVGNVCSFALMDIKKHGNPDWQLKDVDNLQLGGEVQKRYLPKQMEQAEHGKTELSLIHFTLTNPEWKMPVEAKHFIEEIREHALEDLKHSKLKTKDVGTNTAMTQSLMSFGSLGGQYSSIVQSILHTQNIGLPNISTSTFPYPSSLGQGYNFEQMLQSNTGEGPSNAGTSGESLHAFVGTSTTEQIPSLAQAAPRNFNRIRVGKTEGRLEGPGEGLLYSLHGPNIFETMATDITTAEMCFSTLFLHEIHQRQVDKKGVRLAQSQKLQWQQSYHQEEPQTSDRKAVITIAESTPLLSTKKS